MQHEIAPVTEVETEEGEMDQAASWGSLDLLAHRPNQHGFRSWVCLASGAWSLLIRKEYELPPQPLCF